MAQPKLKDMLDKMQIAINKKDLSDDFLRGQGSSTREEAAFGEWVYGISMVPCDWVYPYLKALAEDERLSEIVKDIEREIEEMNS